MQFSWANITRNASTEISERTGLDPVELHACDLRTHLGMLLDRSLGLRAFVQWFNNAKWDMDREGDDDTFDLMGLVELRLAEWTSDYLTDDDLLDVLRTDLEEDGVDATDPAWRAALPATSS